MFWEIGSSTSSAVKFNGYRVEEQPLGLRGNKVLSFVVERWEAGSTGVAVVLPLLRNQKVWVWNG